VTTHRGRQDSRKGSVPGVIQAPSAVVMAVLVGLGGAAEAAAQTAPSPIVPPGRADQATARPQAASPGPQPVEGAARTLPAITPFELTRVEVEGSTLPAEVLEAAWRPYAGRTLDSRGLAAVSDAILAAYDRSGIALYTVVVPTQAFAGGILRINVLEGYVESASVKPGADPQAGRVVQRYLDALEGERPLSRPTLERHVSLIRDIPGVRTDLAFVTGAATESVGMVATVDAQPVQIGLAVNNRGAAFLGRTQIAADLYLNNLAPGGQTRFTYVTPTDTRLFRYIAVGHTQLLGASGATLQLNAGHLRTRPRDSDLTGEATSAGVQLSYPVVRSYTQDLYITVAFDGLNANSAFVGSTYSDDRSRASRLNLLYGRQGARTRLSLSGALSVGIDALGARTVSPELTELSYAKLNGRLFFATSLGDQLVLRLAAAGQLSDDRLPAAEQFALGGSEFGRGYEAAALIGDEGYAASAELAWRAPRLPQVLTEGEAYGFVDGGSTTYRSRAARASVTSDIASAGLGVRATVRRNLAVQLELTKAIGSTPSPNAGDERLVFALRSLW
jgi:hemolysin activation/secretion protein